MTEIEAYFAGWQRGVTGCEPERCVFPAVYLAGYQVGLLDRRRAWQAAQHVGETPRD